MIHEKLPPLSIELLNFCHWLSEWCMYHNSMVTRLTVPSLNFLKSSKNKFVLVIVGKDTNFLTELATQINEEKNFYPIKEISSIS